MSAVRDAWTDERLDDVEPLIEEALAAASEQGVHGQDVTPFVLAYLHRESGGRTAQIQTLLVTTTGILAGLLALISATEMRRRLRPTPPTSRLPEMTA